MNRRSFISLLGLGSVAAAALPIDLIDRLAFARSPTSSIYLPASGVDLSRMITEWQDAMFVEYVRSARDMAFYDGLTWPAA